MPMHRTNKSRRPKSIWDFNSVTGERTVRPLVENMPWFSKNRKRVRVRNIMAKLSRKQNRS